MKSYSNCEILDPIKEENDQRQMNLTDQLDKLTFIKNNERKISYKSLVNLNDYNSIDNSDTKKSKSSENESLRQHIFNANEELEYLDSNDDNNMNYINSSGQYYGFFNANEKKSSKDSDNTNVNPHDINTFKISNNNQYDSNKNQSQNQTEIKLTNKEKNENINNENYQHLKLILSNPKLIKCLKNVNIKNSIKNIENNSDIDSAIKTNSNEEIILDQGKNYNTQNKNITENNFQISLNKINEQKLTYKQNYHINSINEQKKNEVSIYESNETSYTNSHMYGKNGWICHFCKNFNFESKLKLNKR